MANEKLSFTADEVIDLRDMVSAVWASKWIVIFLTVVGAVYGMYRLQQHQPSYTAELVMAPKQSPTTSGASGGLGRLASAIGIGIPGRENQVFDRLRLMLGSVELASRLQEKHNFIHLVYKDSWDPKTQTWNRPKGRMFELREILNAFLKKPLWSEPGLGSLAKEIANSITFEPLEATSFWAMRYSHTDPDIAIYFLKTVQGEVDELLRDQDSAQALKRKLYLEVVLQDTHLRDSREIMMSLLMREENSLMLLKTSLNYAGRLIAAPSVSTQPDIPSLMNIVALPAAGLGIFGLFASILLRLYRKGA